jgi:hypothetical protein
VVVLGYLVEAPVAALPDFHSLWSLDEDGFVIGDVIQRNFLLQYVVRMDESLVGADEIIS